MGHTIDYSGLTGRAKRQKALDDCKSYLGEEQYDKVMAILEQSLTAGGKECSRSYLLLMLFLTQGIEGYPAEAMIDEADGWYHYDNA